MSTRHLNLLKSWLRFTKTASNGEKLNFRWELLSDNRYEDFINFKMNYYVKHELTHVVSGIPKSPKAMEEYRQIVTFTFKDPSHYTIICCVDDEKSDIVAFNALKIYRKGDVYSDVEQAHTPEVKRFYEILHEWNSLCPVPDMVSKYGVDTFFDDAGCAIHPNYRGNRITYEITLLRGRLCEENGIMAGLWSTSVATQTTLTHYGWETVYEIGYKDLEKKLGVKFDNPPPKFIYNVKRI